MSTVDQRIAAIAGGQDNVIDLAQLAAAGMDRKTLQRRLAAGLMQRRHRGVYIVGAARPTFWASSRAAVMAVGEDSAVSHRAALALLGLASPPAGPIDVTVTGRGACRRPGITIHRSTLAGVELLRPRGIPITSAARTICDVAATDPTHVIEELLKEARVQRIISDRELYAVIDRVPHRAGAALVRELLRDESEAGYSRSAAERRLRRLVCDGDLPEPVYNQPLLEFHPDALWTAERIALEVDGRRYHSHPRAFESDRRRDQILAAHGYVVIRVTWRQLVREPMAVAVRIGQAIALRRAA